MTSSDMLVGRAVLITGGGRGGIGGAIAQELAACGAQVYLAGRPGSGIHDPPGCAATLRHIELDVSSEDDWAHAVDVIASASGALYGLVNNAGVLEPPVPFTELGLAQWRRHLTVNLDGTFLGCRIAMHAMAMSGGGAIVNISSGAAHITVPDASAYCVSKAGVLALTRVAAKAGGRHRVRVNAVLPGAIDTPMLWRNLRSGEEPAAFVQNMARQHPIGRIGTVSDVARAVAFLLDPANSFISGAMCAVDGGQLVD
jgi:NAD(P)-dependent dehydrogenase (short-subunit alcohol dehydrogenase family)